MPEVFHDVMKFLSTPSARRATRIPSPSGSQWANFYPRPPRGGRHDGCDALSRVFRISIHALREEGDTAGGKTAEEQEISIHALREEGDPPCARRLPSNRNFYPRPPRGGRPTWPRPSCCAVRHFYPRPPRGGRHPVQGRLCGRGHFYPRPPRGGRPERVVVPDRLKGFLSTPSARRATV